MLKKLLFWRKKTWKKIEYFNPEWKTRIQSMAQLIPESSQSVVDLGCGKMWLLDFLQDDIIYHPVDYQRRGPNTIIADFNKGQFPSIKADVFFVSGCLEYVDDYEWFIENITAHGQHCILSYCSLEHFPDIEDRKQRCWVNHLQGSEVIQLFANHGFGLQQKISGTYFIFHFSRKSL